MANPWFRMYSEFMHDPKVQMMSEQEQRRLVMLLCMRCNSDVTLQDEHVTFVLRVTAEEWQKTKACFIKSGFIDSDNNVLNWDKRQFVSDSSAARVARHRENQKSAVTKCNVTVTPSEQNRTEQKQNRIKDNSATEVAGVEYSKSFLAFWDIYPNKKNKGAAFKAFKKVKPAEYPEVRAGIDRAKKSSDWLKDNGKYIPHPASWLNARGWEDESTSSDTTKTMLVCPNSYPFSDWMKASNQEKAEIMQRHGK